MLDAVERDLLLKISKDARVDDLSIAQRQLDEEVGASDHLTKESNDFLPSPMSRNT